MNSKFKWTNFTIIITIICLLSGFYFFIFSNPNIHLFGNIYKGGVDSPSIDENSIPKFNNTQSPNINNEISISVEETNNSKNNNFDSKGEKESQNVSCEEIVDCDEKPVIYLYNYKTEPVNIQIAYKGEVKSTYPKYDVKNGWNVIAKPDGTLSLDGDRTGKTYEYLFWEGESENKYSFSKGFCIEGSNIYDFLDGALSEMGLNDREIEDFVTYWGPRMQNNKYNIISFQGDNYTDNAELLINPAPQTLIRVFMAWYPSDERVDIKEQKIKTYKRKGTTVVEWGGCETTKKGYQNTLKQQEKDAKLEEEALKQKEQEEREAEQKAYEKLKREQEEQKLINTQQTQNVLLQAPLTPIAPQSAGHKYTDSQGNSTVFTDAEWNKLLGVWSYTGQAEEMISHHSVSELRAVLKYN